MAVTISLTGVVATNSIALNGVTGAQQITATGTVSGRSGGSIVSVNGSTGVVVLNQDDITDGTTYKQYSSTEKTKLAGIEALADVTDTVNVDAAGATMNTDTTLAGNGYFVDEDNMVSNSATKVPSQQSTKAYVDLLESKAVPVVGGIQVNNPALSALHTDLRDNNLTRQINIVSIGDSISTIGEWQQIVANQLYNRYNMNSSSTNLVTDAVGYRTAYPGLAFGSMNGTLEGYNVRGAHIGPGDIGWYTPNTMGMVTPGLAGNYASSPDAAALDIVGDISIAVTAQLSDWSPGSISTLMGKWQSSGQFSYKLDMLTTGRPRLSWSTNGTTVSTADATVAPTLADYDRATIAVQLDVDTGAGQAIKFYTSTDGVTFTQLGATVTSGSTTSIFSSTSILEIGSNTGGTLSLREGKYYRTRVWSGLRDFVAGTGGTTVFDANFELLNTIGQTSFTDTVGGATVTINSSLGTEAYLRTLAYSGALLTPGQSSSTTYTCSGMYIVFGGGGGTLTVKDGGSGGTTVATINTSLYTGDNNLYWVNLTTYASHNVWIGCTIANTILDGICTTNGNQSKGILMWRVSTPGITTPNLTRYASHGANLLTRLKTMTGYEPHYMICTGYNDILTLYADRIQWAIDDGQSRTNGSIIVWAPWGRSTEDTQARSRLAQTIALTENIAVIDAGKVIGNVGLYADYADLSGDNVHPNENGILALAMQGYAVLSGDAIGATQMATWNRYPYSQIFTTVSTAGGSSMATNLIVAGSATINGGVTVTSGGKTVISSLFGIPYYQLYGVSTDAYPQIQFFPKEGSPLSGVVAPLIQFGAGGATAVDLTTGRFAANTFGVSLGGATITNYAAVGGVSKSEATTATNTTTGETDLRSYTVPANVLATNTQSLKFEMHGTCANNANVKTVRIKFGATTLATLTLPTSAVSPWFVKGRIIRTGATTQVAYCTGTVEGETTQKVFDTAPAETLSGAVILKATGQGTSTADITQKSLIVEWKPTNA